MCGPFLLWESVYYKKMNPAERQTLPGSLNHPSRARKDQLAEDYIAPLPAVNLPRASESK